MSKKRVVLSEDESNKRIKAICIFHEFLSSTYTNDELITKNEFEKDIEQRLRQFILEDKEREKRNKQIENEIKEKRETKKNYSQK
jgi:ABC-type phosphate/phosphonate transport system substrate-binding protein